AISTRFFVDRAGYLDGAWKIGKGCEKGFHGDNGSSKAAFHIAGASPINLAVADDPGKGIDCPAFACLNDVYVGIEMHDRTWAGSFLPANNVDAGIAVIVARRALGAQILDLETGHCHAPA